MSKKGFLLGVLFCLIFSMSIVVLPLGKAIADDEANTNTNTDMSTNATNETIVESNIIAPTNAKTEYVATTNKIKISWNKSDTSDIDGYHIFRSIDKTKDFTRISQTDSKTYEYLDTVFEPEKTYYYYVVGYKDLSDGLKSNTAEIKTPKTAAVKKTTTPVTTPVKKTTNWWLYVLIGADVLLVVFFIIYELKLKKLWAKKKKENQWKKK